MTRRRRLLPDGTIYEDPNTAVPEEDRATTPVVYTGLFTARPDTVELSKAQLVTWFLGSHEYLLQCIEGWAAQIVLRTGLDDMFDIQYTLWGDTVLHARQEAQGRVPGHHGQHGRGLDERPPARRDRAARQGV